jgi:hypothetical protein
MRGVGLDEDGDAMERELINATRYERLIRVGKGFADIVAAVAERSSGRVLVKAIFMVSMRRDRR